MRRKFSFDIPKLKIGTKPDSRSPTADEPPSPRTPVPKSLINLPSDLDFALRAACTRVVESQRTSQEQTWRDATGPALAYAGIQGGLDAILAGRAQFADDRPSVDEWPTPPAAAAATAGPGAYSYRPNVAISDLFKDDTERARLAALQQRTAKLRADQLMHASASSAALPPPRSMTVITHADSPHASSKPDSAHSDASALQAAPVSAAGVKSSAAVGNSGADEVAPVPVPPVPVEPATVKRPTEVPTEPVEPAPTTVAAAPTPAPVAPAAPTAVAAEPSQQSAPARRTLRSDSVGTTGSSPHTETTDYPWNAAHSTGMTSAVLTPARGSSQRGSSLQQNAADAPGKDVPLNADWMRTELEKHKRAQEEREKSSPLGAVLRKPVAAAATAGSRSESRQGIAAAAAAAAPAAVGAEVSSRPPTRQDRPSVDAPRTYFSHSNTQQNHNVNRPESRSAAERPGSRAASRAESVSQQVRDYFRPGSALSSHGGGGGATGGSRRPSMDALRAYIRPPSAAANHHPSTAATWSSRKQSMDSDSAAGLSRSSTAQDWYYSQSASSASHARENNTPATSNGSSTAASGTGGRSGSRWRPWKSSSASRQYTTPDFSRPPSAAGSRGRAGTGDSMGSVVGSEQVGRASMDANAGLGAGGAGAGTGAGAGSGGRPAVNLNRELPPLPGLDQWKEPEEVVVEPPKEQAQQPQQQQQPKPSRARHQPLPVPNSQVHGNNSSSGHGPGSRTQQHQQHPRHPERHHERQHQPEKSSPSLVPPKAKKSLLNLAAIIIPGASSRQHHQQQQQHGEDSRGGQHRSGSRAGHHAQPHVPTVPQQQQQHQRPKKSSASVDLPRKEVRGPAATVVAAGLGALRSGRSQSTSQQGGQLPPHQPLQSNPPEPYAESPISPVSGEAEKVKPQLQPQPQQRYYSEMRFQDQRYQPKQNGVSQPQPLQDRTNSRPLPASSHGGASGGRLHVASLSVQVKPTANGAARLSASHSRSQSSAPSAGVSPIAATFPRQVTSQQQQPQPSPSTAGHSPSLIAAQSSSASPAPSASAAASGITALPTLPADATAGAATAASPSDLGTSPTASSSHVSTEYHTPVLAHSRANSGHTAARPTLHQPQQQPPLAHTASSGSARSQPMSPVPVEEAGLPSPSAAARKYSTDDPALRPTPPPHTYSSHPQQPQQQQPPPPRSPAAPGTHAKIEVYAPKGSPQASAQIYNSGRQCESPAPAPGIGGPLPPYLQTPSSAASSSSPVSAVSASSRHSPVGGSQAGSTSRRKWWGGSISLSSSQNGSSILGDERRREKAHEKKLKEKDRLMQIEQQRAALLEREFQRQQEAQMLQQQQQQEQQQQQYYYQQQQQQQQQYYYQQHQQAPQQMVGEAAEAPRVRY